MARSGTGCELHIRLGYGDLRDSKGGEEGGREKGQIHVLFQAIVHSGGLKRGALDLNRS